MDPMEILVALVGANVLVNVGVFHRLGAYGARILTLEREIKQLKTKEAT